MRCWFSRILVVSTTLSIADCSTSRNVSSLDELFLEVAATPVPSGLQPFLDAPLGQVGGVGAYPPGQVPTSLLRSSTPGLRTPGLAHLTSFGHDLARSVVPMPRAVVEVPYWGSISRSVAAPMGDGVFLATNLVYPIYRYAADGELLDSLNAPPASWRQARRPGLGEFVPGREEQFRTYLGSFSVIAALAVVADSVLVVAHGQLDPDAGGLWVVVTRTLDVYVGGRRIATDLPAPGELIAYSGSSLFFLRGDATVSEYQWLAG